MTEPQSFIYESEYVALGRLKPIFSALKRLGVPYVKIKVMCPDKEIIDLVNESLGLKSPRRKPEDFDAKFYMLGKKNLSIEEAKKKKFKKIIDFNNNSITKIFVNEYRNHLKSLGNEFDLYMVWQGPLIKIFSQSWISSLFESNIIQMKKRLRWLTITSPEICTKLYYSEHIQEQLKAKHINILFMSKKLVFLHSSIYGSSELLTAKESLMYETVVLRFNHLIYSSLVNRLYFKILMYHCQPFLDRMSKNYEIRAEIYWKKMGIILHTPDPVFSQQPKKELACFLSNILTVSYTTLKAGQHFTHICHAKPRSKCLQVMMTKRYIHTCWDKNKEIRPLEVVKVFGKLFEEINLNTMIQIGVRTGGFNLNFSDWVEELAQKHRFFTQFPQSNGQKWEILNLKFKSFINYEAKVRQLSQFLQELLAGEFLAEEEALSSLIKSLSSMQ